MNRKKTNKYLAILILMPKKLLTQSEITGQIIRLISNEGLASELELGKVPVTGMKARNAGMVSVADKPPVSGVECHYRYNISS